jgi:hypothetical protein
MDWVSYQACLEDRLPGSPSVNDEEAIDKCVEELSNAIQEAQRRLLQGVVTVPIHSPLYPLIFGMKYG